MALQEAQAFLTGRGRPFALQSSARAAMRGEREQTDACDYYIFNLADNGGFVIVSGDDRTVPVLGYADSGMLSDATLPDGLRDLLNSYSAEIASLNSSPMQGRLGGVLSSPTQGHESPVGFYGCGPIARISERVSISPLIPTQWSQGSPYNLLAPLCQTDKGLKHGLTGCVATAMAQMMYYHRWPNASTQPIPGYINEKDSQLIDGLPVTTFDWDAMVPIYDSTATSEARQAVAKLMQYCGRSVEMAYSTTSSSAYTSDAPLMLIKYFDYDSSAVNRQRSYYTPEEWNDLLYNELAQGRPLLYSGQRAAGGHSFICDGYDTDDYFHFNFGWSGRGDGYFRVSALNPSYGDGGYCSAQYAIFGIRPNTGAAPAFVPIRLRNLSFSKNDTTLTRVYYRDSVHQSFPKMPLQFNITNISKDTLYMQYALNVFGEDGQDEGAIYRSSSTDPAVIGGGKGMVYTLSRAVNTDTVHAIYHVKFQARPFGTEEWKEVIYNDRFTMTLIVDSLKLTVKMSRTFSQTPNLIDIVSCGPHQVGKTDTVTVRIAAYDGELRSGDMYLKANGKKVSLQHAYAQRDDTTAVMFVYTPAEEGTDTLTVWDYQTQVTSTDSLYTGILVPIAPEEPSAIELIPADPANPSDPFSGSQSPSRPRKVFLNGRLYIIAPKAIYDASGRIVRTE